MRREQAKIRRWGEQSGRTSKYKVTEAGRCLASLRNSKECSVAGEEEKGRRR